MRDLSPKQQKIIAFIREFVRDKDYPPSIRDIQLACNISSTSVVDYNLKALEKQGLIRRDREISRAIEVLDARGRRPRVVDIPLMGTIAAGQPITAPDSGTFALDAMDTIPVTEDFIGGREDVFALRVKGTSMIDALIDDGDIVLMQHTDHADDGEMVAVWLKHEGETTLKKFYREGDRVRLQPMNATMDPIYTTADNVEIQGRVVSTLRLPG
ncbi:MAG: transcriptional repressor LexA [Chloroflexi bacterium]|nr:transcriptional repressor LexA [Chloroflexota bacterium]